MTLDLICVRVAVGAVDGSEISKARKLEEGEGGGVV